MITIHHSSFVPDPLTRDQVDALTTWIKRCQAAGDAASAEYLREVLQSNRQSEAACLVFPHTFLADVLLTGGDLDEDMY